MALLKTLGVSCLGVLLAGAAHAAPQQALIPKQTTSTIVAEIAPETDPASPRRTKLQGDNTSSTEILRIDLDGDGDPDILERWWNGKRARWFDENDDMTEFAMHGDQADDFVQIDRDGDGYYDGPGDMSVDWTDDDGDGDADLQTVAINVKPAGAPGKNDPHYMIFVDVDDDNVHGYVDWQTFEFPCWHAVNTTRYKQPELKTAFSPDYNGNAIFLKEHVSPMAISDPRLNWENPFGFFDFDGDGATEMAMRFCDNRVKHGMENARFDGVIKTSYVSFDLDNDAQKGNEMDFDMTLKFSGGEMLPYMHHVHKHPKLKAPAWVLPYCRFANWREIDELIYVPHAKMYDEMFKPKWEQAWFTFDEDDDDHRWERVELYEADSDPYSLERGGRGSKSRKIALSGHVQSDSLGDRGEFDLDFSGQGKLYVGRWDKKIHLYGAEWGAWTVDYNGDYWGGSGPTMVDSSPKRAEKVGEVVEYRDTDGNGFIDEIAYDYDGDKKTDFRFSLLELEGGGKAKPDEAEVVSPAELKWQGLHALYKKISEESWESALTLYRAAWSAGLNTPELDSLSVAATTAQKYDHGYWLKEKLFRMMDARLKARGEEKARKELARHYFGADYAAMARFIGSRGWE